MVKLVGYASIVLGLAGMVLTASPTGAGKPKDGKAIFIENKCQSCHSIKNECIERKKVAGDEEAAADTSKKKPPDLSNVGGKHDAAWMGRFLMKLEVKDGEKHKRKFKSSEADLKTLTGWLETLKKPKDK